MTSILRVALPVPLHTLFDYREGAAEAAVGCRVRVPFGRRELVGIVAERVDGSTLDEARLKVAGAVLDEAPLLGGELLASLRWAARYYQHPLGEVLFAALPTSLRNARALPAAGIAAVELTPAGATALADGAPRRGTRIAALLEALADGPLATAQLDALAGAAARRNALARGWIAACRLAAPARAAAAVAGPPLNDAQQDAATAVIAAAGGFAPFLLDGVTGSGKTEVYLEIIRDCLARGRQALVLVPEIALTPQALRRFRARLGIDVAALHSGLGDVERARAWLAAARGEAPLVLGTRSAVLVPLARPGVIVVDEEHDASYKQQEGFRYHARDLAVVRAKALGIPIVLGSATPSLESLANVDAQRYRPLRLDHRAGRAQPPALRVVDLRRQRLQHGLAAPAIEAIAACIGRGEQVLVFRNRRGYAPVLLCHDCGWSARCPDCERALTLHKREHRLRCHHCGHEEGVPNACPSCAGLALHALGEGTERLEDALGAQFPGVPVVRVDRDTTRGRRLRDALLDSLPEAGARILVGTQMLAKGHDLPHLTLVVVVGVDEGLYSVDFRAGERLGQLVVQVAGRAGRADRPGTVILQTHDPAHPLLGVLLNGGYRALAARLLEERRSAGLPPFTQFALLRAEAPQQDELDRFLRAAASAATAAPGVTLHGPLAAPMPRRAGAWRAQILVEADERSTLQAFLPGWLDAVRALPDERRVRWSIDVDPVDLY
ncbi:primosomal protein N' (replication factor Y) [Dokdonella fugitiva]|uniref:Replication restart protein PriA n=1 Tax=Dokdonella fugitiva TaxID=328517 RepID=A0A839FBR4_9GAMM|nr:primosomal protein N' [Dokdonella fugitiva]MBA8889524.1 primosomal protein N' (replication factor Y) [Dokdonella fugitiva]